MDSKIKPMQHLSVKHPLGLLYCSINDERPRNNSLMAIIHQRKSTVLKEQIRFTNASSIAQERQHLKHRVIIQKHHHSTLITDASRNDSVEPIYYTSLHQTLMVEYNNYKNERASSRGRLFGLKIQSRFRAFLWGTRGVLLSLALAWGYVRLEGIIFMTNFRLNLLQVYLFLLVIILKPIYNIGLYLILLQNKLINIFTILIHLRFISIMPCLFFLQF